MDLCNVCNAQFENRSHSKALARRSVTTRLRNQDITTFEALRQLYNYEVLAYYWINEDRCILA